MKYKSVSRPLLAFGLASVLALSIADCKSSSNGPSGGSGEAGEAGSTSQTGQGPSSFCGKVSAFSECDPLTASPCNAAAGQTCDYDFPSGTFKCFTWPKFSAAGELCGETNNCGPTVTCNINIEKCQHFCCSDADCDQGSCYAEVFSDGNASVGVCGDEFVELGAAGAGGAAP